VTDPDRPDRVEYRMERTYEVAATPEQVWDAIATAEGMSAWMVPTELDPQVGGEVSFDLGDFTSTGVVTAYTPHQRVAYEEPGPIAGQVMPEPIATEFVVESASGGSCVIRMVQSAYGTGADWENEFFDQMMEDWVVMLDKLVVHLRQAG
jgi:uncharacterized protein YndB with AHSA1/START domain